MTRPDSCRRCGRRCGPQRGHCGRGLCNPCRVWAREHSRLGDYPPTRTTIDADEHDRLAAQGLSVRAIADRFRVTPGAIGNHRHRRGWSPQ